MKTGYKLELLSPDTMKLLVNKKKKKKNVDQDKDGEDMPILESVAVALLHCNLVNHNCQQASKVLFTFKGNKQFAQLITVAPHSLTMLNTTNTEFSFIEEIWFTNQNSKPLEIENNVSITIIVA